MKTADRMDSCRKPETTKQFLMEMIERR